MGTVSRSQSSPYDASNGGPSRTERDCLLSGTGLAEPTINALYALTVVLGLALTSTAASPDDRPAQSPDHDLPPHITRLTLFGERADFSHDGRRVLFVEKTFGDAYEIDLETRAIRLLTGHYKHLGYTRALYLANGDILLSGPERFDPKDPGPSRVQCFLSVLDKDLTRPPTPLGTKCSEGPAVSRTRMHIAWTHVAEQYPDEMPPGSSRIYEADVAGRGRHPEAGGPEARARQPRPAVPLHAGVPELPTARRARADLQRLRPPGHRRLRRRPGDEAGRQLLGRPRPVRRARGDLARRPLDARRVRPRGSGGRGPGHVDIWKLSLDGSGPGSG